MNQGDRVREHRKRKGMSQEKLGEISRLQPIEDQQDRERKL